MLKRSKVETHGIKSPPKTKRPPKPPSQSVNKLVEGAKIVKSSNFGKALSWQEFKELLQLIESKHTFRKAVGKCIKYVRPDLDMRTHDVFHIVLDGFPHSKEFDFRDSETDMYERIIDWLEN